MQLVKYSSKYYFLCIIRTIILSIFFESACMLRLCINGFTPELPFALRELGCLIFNVN